MSSLAEDHIDFIQFLNKLSPEKRTKLIHSLSSCHINTLSEIFKNFLLKNITTNPKIIKRLKPYKKEVGEVAKRKTPIYKKRKILKSIKGGAILSILLPVATAILSTLFS